MTHGELEPASEVEPASGPENRQQCQWLGRAVSTGSTGSTCEVCLAHAHAGARVCVRACACACESAFGSGDSGDSGDSHQFNHKKGLIQAVFALTRWLHRWLHWPHWTGAGP
jgi:hypothetical protein